MERVLGRYGHGRRTEIAISDGAQLGNAEDPRALRRRVLGFAWPVIGQNLFETTLSIVSTMLVAGLGTGALAGVGSALQIMLFVLAALAALAAGNDHRVPRRHRRAAV